MSEMTEVVEELARGGDGRIVAAGALVVRKEHRRAASFQAELDALRDLRAPGIVPLIGICYENLSLFYPRYDLDLLAALLGGHAVDADAVFRSVLGALSACHARGLLHRDVKAENVLVKLDGPAFVLCDFARAIQLGEGEDEVSISFCGTTAYAAPEALRKRYCRASDCFSAGCLFFAVAFRGLPFEDEELLDEVEQEPPMEEEGLEVKHAALVRRLLRWKPEARPTADEALQLLV